MLRVTAEPNYSAVEIFSKYLPLLYAVDNMGGGVPLVVFAAGAFLILAYKKSGNNLDLELDSLPEKWHIIEP